LSIEPYHFRQIFRAIVPGPTDDLQLMLIPASEFRREK
jgi:hypothetical protein